MLSRSSFKTELVAYRTSLKPPKVPGDPGPLGVGNRNSADLELLDRWIADERAEELWKKIKRPPVSDLSAQELIRTVLRARRSAQASVNCTYEAKSRGRVSRGWAGSLSDLKNRIIAELSKPPSALSPLSMAKILDRAADEARELNDRHFDFSDHLGLPGRPRFALSRKDQGGTRVRKLFMQILGEFFTARPGRLFDDEVAVLTEIAFPGRVLDRDEVTAARKPTTMAQRRGKTH